MSAPDLEAELRRLADREAIRDLARRYAHCMWRSDAAGAIDLFAEDGAMDLGDAPPIRGRRALLETYQRVLGDGSFQPFVHNHVIDLAGDRATGTCYLDLRASLAGRSMIGAGWYDDEYVREAGAWKFHSRRLTLSWFVPLREGWVEGSGEG